MPGKMQKKTREIVAWHRTDVAPVIGAFKKAADNELA